MWRWTRVKFVGELLVMSAPELAIFGCLMCMGCAGVIPLPKATHTPMGPEPPIRLDFLQVGQTTRAEVAEKLRVCDTGVNSERFFVGRWISSTWGWFVASQYQSDGGRHWSATNLLVEFDETGVVKRFETFSDGALVRSLSRVAQDSKLRESGEPIELTSEPCTCAGPHPFKIVLSGGNVEFRGLGSAKKPKDFTVAASKISGVSSGHNGADPVYARVAVHFDGGMQAFGGPKGKTLYARLRVVDVVKLLSYLRANGCGAA